MDILGEGMDSKSHTKQQLKQSKNAKSKSLLKQAKSRAQKKKSAAPMEEKTVKILEKIKKYYEDIEKQITPQALKETSDKIRSWIARHAPDREVLKTKDFSLFNANRQPAQMSDTMSKIRQRTQEDLAIFAKQHKAMQNKSLKGHSSIALNKKIDKTD